MAGVLSLLVCVGCGGGDVPDLGRVEGTITLDGQPVPGAVVTFQPEGARPSYGKTDDAGKYKLYYTDGNEGATLGTHVVSISTRDDGDPDEGVPPTREKVPSNYNTRTELKTEVKAGTNTCDFDLKSGGKISQSTDAKPD